MIYICIPSHNEEHTVGILLWKIRQVLTAFPRDYQLLVLDDGSSDRTPEVLAPYARILPLTVLHHPKRKGYAASLDELLREAVRRSEYPRRDVVVTLQADFTEEPDEIPSLLKRIESGADVVTTRLEIAPAHAPRALRWTRAIALRLLRRLGWPENVTDMLSGFRAYRVAGLRKALEERAGDRLLEWHDAWAANAALLKAVHPFARRVDEVRVAFRPDRLQRPTRFDTWATARQLARLALGRDSATPVPARHGGPAVVSAEELAAAADAGRAAEPAGRRRGPGERPGSGSRRVARDGDGRAPARSRTRETATGPSRAGRPAHPERPERSGRGKAERAPAGEGASPRAQTPQGGARTRGGRTPSGRAGEPAETTADTAVRPAAKSRRKRRGGADAAPVDEHSLPREVAALPDAGPPPPEAPFDAGASSAFPELFAAPAALDAQAPFAPADPGDSGALGAPDVPDAPAALSQVDAAAPAPDLPLQALGAGESLREMSELQLDLEMLLEGGSSPGEGRRRRRSRRGRGRRGRATPPDASGEEAPDAGEAADPDDESEGAGGRSEGEGQNPGPGESEPAAVGRRRRSRRGGRGRSRARRAAEDALGAAGDTDPSANAHHAEGVDAAEPSSALPPGASDRLGASEGPGASEGLGAAEGARTVEAPGRPERAEAPWHPPSPDEATGEDPHSGSSEREREQE